MPESASPKLLPGTTFIPGSRLNADWGWRHHVNLIIVREFYKRKEGLEEGRWILQKLLMHKVLCRESFSLTTKLRENFVGSVYTYSDNISSHAQSIHYWKWMIHNQLGGWAQIQMLAGTKAANAKEPEFVLGPCKLTLRAWIGFW